MWAGAVGAARRSTGRTKTKRPAPARTCARFRLLTTAHVVTRAGAVRRWRQAGNLPTPARRPQECLLTRDQRVLSHPSPTRSGRSRRCARRPRRRDDHGASAVLTARRERMGRALKAVEDVSRVVLPDLEGLVVLIPADLATCLRYACASPSRFCRQSIRSLIISCSRSDIRSKTCAQSS
jgi:hypothetical protein